MNFRNYEVKLALYYLDKFEFEYDGNFEEYTKTTERLKKWVKLTLENHELFWINHSSAIDFEMSNIS